MVTLAAGLTPSHTIQVCPSMSPPQIRFLRPSREGQGRFHWLVFFSLRNQSAASSMSAVTVVSCSVVARRT
jgi:hypothetical protein